MRFCNNQVLYLELIQKKINTSYFCQLHKSTNYVEITRNFNQKLTITAVRQIFMSFVE